MTTETEVTPPRGVSGLRAIIERLPDGIVIVDRQGSIRFANPAAERLFARRAEDLLGTSFGFPCVVGETTEIDIVQRGGSGVVYAELRVVDTEWEDEEVQLVSLRDITDRKEAQERANQLVVEREARLEAEAASRAKSEFLAIMSHELRTPLNAVLGYAELLELGISGPLTEKMREQIGRIRISATHLLGLVNDILDLARVEAGRLEVSTGPASSAGTIAAALALIHPQVAARGLSLTVLPTPDPVPIYLGDEERVRQIMVNLLSNAVKFTPAGGSITVEVGQPRCPDAGTRIKSNRSYMSFRVIDNGPGIPAEKLRTIFDPFVQVESGHSRSREGSGLGLTISRRLARLMGGDLTVASELEKGSTFTLWMPAEESAERRRAIETIAGDTVPVQHDVSGLGEIGRAIIDGMERTIELIVDRLRHDSNLAVAGNLQFSQLADHLPTLLADVAGALAVIEEAKGSPSPTLADAVEIQRLIAERHGAQRHRLGWSESAVRREFMIIREELENVIRAVSPGGGPLPLEESVTVVGRFLDQAEYLAVRALIAAGRA